jgi:uncharacterized protein YggE
LQSQARLKAITRAKAKALQVAQAGGFQLGKLLSIEEGYTAQPQSPSYFSKDMAVGEAVRAPSPTIEPGSQEINTTVTLRYEIR